MKLVTRGKQKSKPKRRKKKKKKKEKYTERLKVNMMKLSV